MKNLYSYYFQVVFFLLIIVNHLIEIYLSRRQISVLQKNKNSVPDEFKNFLTIQDHQKAINYATSRLNFGQARLVWDALVLFYWFPFRSAEKLYLSLPEWGTHREVLFLVLFGLIQMLLSLPWSVYSTFILENKYGFNRTTPALFISDRIKGIILGASISVPALYLIFFLYEKLGSAWWVASFIVLTIIQLGIVWLYPTYIAPLFNKFQPLETEDLKRDIENLVEKAGFKAQGIFVMDASKRSSHGNAYFTGIGKSKRIVFFDTLLKDLSKEEIIAILAHELGHLKLKHIIKSLCTSLVFSFVGFGLMGILAKEYWFYSGHFIRVISPAVLVLLFTQVISLYTFWMTPLFSYVSRRREFQADAYAATESNANDLITGLLKLYQKNASPVVSDILYSTFYHSHPPALERIKKLLTAPL